MTVVDKTRASDCQRQSLGRGSVSVQRATLKTTVAHRLGTNGRVVRAREMSDFPYCELSEGPMRITRRSIAVQPLH